MIGGFRVAVLATFVAASVGHAQESALPTEAEVREVLETSKITSILGSLGAQFATVLRRTAPSLSKDALEEIRGVTAEAFAPDLLYPHVVEYVRSRADQGQLADLRAWLLSEPFRQIQAKADPEEMAESLEQYAERMQMNPPPRERIALAARYVEAQRAGEFYVLMRERLRAAARRVAERAGGADAVGAAEPTEAERANEVQQYRLFALISFLQRLEPLSDEEALQLVEAYESASGQWYVETYTAALLSAIDAAAEVAVAQMSS